MSSSSTPAPEQSTLALVVAGLATLVIGGSTSKKRGYRAASVLIVLLAFPLYAQAVPAPIVFDFEDGLQGWEVHASARRVQTQILGGEWAILGDPSGLQGRLSVVLLHGISAEMDFTNVAAISWTQLYTGEGQRPTFITINFIFSSGNFFTQPGSTDNPGTARFKVPRDQFPLAELEKVSLSWGFGSVGFIDNITFHPVPEPGTLTLLAGSLVALVIARRRIV